MDLIVILIPLLPFTAAAAIGVGHLFGWLDGEAGETTTVDIAVWAIILSSLLALTLLGGDMMGKNAGSFSVGQWLGSETLDIRVNFLTTGFGVVLAALFTILLFIVMRFSTNYMHKEAGFHRFFFILSLFSAAMLLLVLSGNAVGTFIGWEIAGLCSYLLIAYYYERPVAAQNATRVFVTNRIGDAAFLLGIGLSYAWAGDVNWARLTSASAQLSTGQATVIALCFAVAACVKSAQIPFTPWLARAMEGPTPSSAIFYGAVMVHAGVYLLILLEPIFEQAPLAMALVAVAGLLTAVYGFVVGLTQTDVKSSLVFATSGQLGLMFMECGLGFWQLASWHLCAHAVVRGYQVLVAPSLVHHVHDNPIKPVAPAIARMRWAYVASLQRFWLDQITDWTLVKPIRRLAHDLTYFDDHIVDRTLGVSAPAIRAISTLAQLEEQKIGARLDNEVDSFAQGSGLAGKITEWAAAIMHWFEDSFVLRGIGKNAIRYGRQLGYAANKVELLLFSPRYLVLFIFITLLIAF
ncbi:NADH-quinone oxidoreductase subunit L [Methylobacter sp. BBA5.1]|uniref:NADH-quinone oxidoreductase subunit 5 family protein n=1 Tax=Methylobacter sp. BBA5.1 TaxID=1495064 RepID=UPI0005645C8C|nr:proton-conducting transporter membrane subunit [Methylobacter sp. BBA5.1]